MGGNGAGQTRRIKPTETEMRADKRVQGEEPGQVPVPNHGRNRRPAEELPDRQVKMIKLNYKPHEQWGSSSCLGIGKIK